MLKKTLQSKKPLSIIFLFFLTATLFIITPLVSRSSARDASVSPRIVYGEVAKIEKWPGIVSLMEREETSSFQGHICGGTLVAEGWVLTAGHCLFGEDLDVVVGRENIKTREGERYSVSKTYLHPKYKEIGRIDWYDFALLKLEGFQSSEKIMPLANKKRLPRFLKTAGWGETGTSSRSNSLKTPIETYPMGPSPQLREIRIPSHPDRVCKKIYRELYHNRSMICAGGYKGRDVCFGDSGGPLISKGRLFAVTSFGRSCAGTPSVFADVSVAKNWIRKTIINNTELPEGDPESRPNIAD